MSRRFLALVFLLALLPTAVLPSGGIVCVCKILHLPCAMPAEPGASCCARHPARPRTSIGARSDCRLCVPVPASPRAKTPEGAGFDRSIENAFIDFVRAEIVIVTPAASRPFLPPPAAPPRPNPPLLAPLVI